MCRTVTLVLVVAMAMVFVIALSCDVAAEPPAKASPPLDLGFEAGNPGELPAKWFVPTTGWQGELWDEDASDGKRSAKLSPSGNSEIAFGNLMRVVDASEYRGQQVRLSAHIRVEGDGASAMMWLRVDRPGQQMGFFDNMANRPIRSSHWTEAVIEGDVAADAIQLALGVMSLGGGTVFIDDVKLVSSGAASVQAATPARAATARGLENLQAAARLLAYVRFFHPSDEAIAVQDWDRFAVELMEAAEPAENAEQLAEALRRMFAPIAPTLAVWAGGVGDAPRRLPIPADAQYLRYWRHYGAGRVATGQSLYHSQTKQLRLPPQRDETAITATLATWASQELGGKDARSAFESPDLVKDLGGGVSCRLPVMVFVGNNGSLPRGTQENRWAASQPGPRLTALNRSTRLAGVTICWGVMQHFYPYFDVINTDWDAVLPTALAQAAEAADEVAYLHVLQELVGQLHDGHGNVYDSRARSALALPLALDWAGAELVVMGKHASVPAQVAVGDVVLSINGQSVEDVCDRLAPRISAATEGWRRHVLSLRLRTEASQVDPCPLRLRKPDGTEYGTTMALCSMQEPIESGLAKPANGAELAAGIVYFDLNGAGTDALDEVFDKLLAAKGIVFDVRGYPNDAAMKVLVHLRDKHTASARWNVPIVVLPDRQGWKWQESAWDLPPVKPRLSAKIAFVTDGRAISYAESIMGIVEHYRLGEIVGGTTAGTNGNVNPFSLPGGFAVAWTGMKVLKHDGSQHHGIGILPTVAIEPTPAGIAANRDEVLEKATEVISAQLVTP